MSTDPQRRSVEAAATNGELPEKLQSLFETSVPALANVPEPEHFSF